MSKLNPRTTKYEFSGPAGACAISVGLPILIEVLYFACNEEGCPATWSSIKQQALSKRFLSSKVLGIYLLWLFGLAVLDLIVPGEVVRGTQLRNGKHLVYKFNGTRIILLLSAALIYRAWYTEGLLPELNFVYNHLLELANASLLVAVVISTILYVDSFRGNKLLALGGNSGSIVYDWFIGRELNPRWGPLDVKLFLEMRPGLLLWVLINIAMAHHQWLKIGRVTNSMVIVTCLQGFYVVEGTFYEKGLVSMIDTTMDGLGFMLVFGDVSLVPFTYTLQSRYLADHPMDLSPLAVFGIIAVYLVGLAIFRFSNNEKSRFKSGHPSAKHLKFITSSTGSKLIVSSWWGLARHINYTGDWILSLAYCLPCGTAVIPYYYMIYFASLLIHRAERDDAKCAEKYGKTWEEYKRLVPYCFIPGIY